MPYSGRTTVREFFDLSTERNGDTWFVVTTIVEDPEYLTEPLRDQLEFQEASRRGWLEPTTLFGPLALLRQTTDD